jgi:hypothetical protein
MYKSFVLYSGNTINVMIQFKNLPGYPPQTETDSTLVYVSNPLGAGHFVYYTNPITKETVSLNGEKLMYGKQGMYKAEGTYKFSVVMPDKYQPPDNSWNVDSGYMTKTVTAQKGKTVYVNIIFKDNDGNTINDKGQLVITNPFTADTYIWYNDKAIGGGAKINNTTMAYQAVGKYKIKVLVPVGYTIPDST